MAFKMKKPSIIEGTSVHKNAIKLNRDMDRTNVADGRAGSSALQKKDFGMEESGMKFRKIGSKIREKLAKRKIIDKTDPAIDSKGKRQDIAETGMVQTKRKRNRLEQFQVDESGKVVRKRKTKFRGKKKIVKDVDASGRKTKRVMERDPMSGGEFKETQKSVDKRKKKEGTVLEKTRKLGKTVKGVAAEKRVEGARKGEASRLRRQNKVIKEANKKARELDKAAYDKWAEGKRAEGFEVGPYTETTRKEGAAAAKMRSPMKKETETSGKATKTTKGETKVIPGETTTTPSGSADFNKAFGEACQPGVKFFYYKGEKKTCDRAPSTKTTPDKTETAEYKGSYKEQPLLEAKRTKGEFGDLDEKQTRKKRPPRGKNRGKISLKNLFIRDRRGRKIPCGANFAE